MLVQLQKLLGGRIAVDHYRIDLVEEESNTVSLVHLSLPDEGLKRFRVAHSFDEVLRRFRDAVKAEFDEPKEPWQEDEDDWD